LPPHHLRPPLARGVPRLLRLPPLAGLPPPVRPLLLACPTLPARPSLPARLCLPAPLCLRVRLLLLVRLALSVRLPLPAAVRSGNAWPSPPHPVPSRTRPTPLRSTKSFRPSPTPRGRFPSCAARTNRPLRPPPPDPYVYRLRHPWGTSPTLMPRRVDASVSR